IGTNLLAEPRYFVDERDGKREKRIQRVLHHLSRFRAHEEDLRCEGRKQFLEQRFFCVVSRANYYTLRLFKGINGFAEAKILRRAGESKLREFLLQHSTRPDW